MREGRLYAKLAEAWPVPSENLLVDTLSARTFVRASGRATDPPLFLLPGARGTSLMWVPMIAALSGWRRTYALDTVNDAGLSVRRHDNWPPDALVKRARPGSFATVGLGPTAPSAGKAPSAPRRQRGRRTR